MSVSVCPIAVVNASPERVWEFLSKPSNYALWWDAQTQAIIPEGRAHAGQKIYAKTNGLNVLVIVNGIDESKRHIDLTTQLPFGITVFNHITCVALPDSTTQVSFG
jgi:ligand-binding SRPBCC domain-containing protein